MQKARNLVSLSLLFLQTTCFAQTAFKVSTETNENAIITSIWAGGSAFVDEPQWNDNGKSFVILESTGEIHQIGYPSFELMKSRNLRVGSDVLRRCRQGFLLVDKFNSRLVVVNAKTLNVKYKIQVPKLHAAVASPHSDLIYVLAGDRPLLHIVDLKSGDITKFDDPELPEIGGQFLNVTPNGTHVFVGDRAMYHLKLNGKSLEYIGKSPSIASNPGGIYVSPDSQYVALPSGGGNDGVAGLPRSGYNTYLFETKNLKENTRSLPTGAYPRSIGWDAKNQWVYAQDFDYQLKVFNNQTGVLHSQHALSTRGNDGVRYTSHPDGKGRVLCTMVNHKPQKNGPARLFFVEIR